MERYQARDSSQATSSRDSAYFTRRDAVIITASRFIKDRDVVFVGQGLPVITSIFAKRNHAKSIVIMNEYGVVDANPSIAVELAHPMFAESATYLCDMVDALACLIYHVDVAFLGAAQIDRYGNVNTTSIGDYLHPKIRISGSGGANDIGSLAPKFVLLMDKQRAPKFTQKVDYVTTPGFFVGSRVKRKRFGLQGSGPEVVITDLGVYRFMKTTGEIYLDALQSGVSIEEAKENTEWKLKTSKRVQVVPPPTREEVDQLRSIDPR
ncbi:MAG: CoA-transferase subunit beta, partial [Nitrososphaerales archaeon]